MVRRMTAVGRKRPILTANICLNASATITSSRWAPFKLRDIV
jgi:hypothetical protein